MEAALIVDPPANGPWNMARDQQLAEYASEHRIVVLRTYRWSVPTLSLGRFQDRDEGKSLARRLGVEWVRRTTGGGAILHHHDWTYSIAWPTDAKKGPEERLYQEVHQGIAKWLRGFGWIAGLHRDAPNGLEPGSSCQVPSVLCSERLSADARQFLCFERRSPWDLVALANPQGGLGDVPAKVLGSAQRRVRGAISQHGSLLLAQSPFTPHLLGLEELTRFDPPDQGISRYDQEGFGDSIMGSLIQIGVSKWRPMTIQSNGYQWEKALHDFAERE